MVWAALGLALLLWLVYGTRGLGQKELYRLWLEYLPFLVAGISGLMGFAVARSYAVLRHAHGVVRARLMYEWAFPIRRGRWYRGWQEIREAWLRGLEARWARWLLGPWRAAGISGSFLALLWVAVWVMGFVVFLWRPILSGLALILSLGLLRWWVEYQARQQRRRFHDQLPEALDRLADALQAGFSFPQALEFIRPNMAEPIRSELERILVHVRLGRPLEDAFEELYKRYPSSEMHILVKGLNLQRRAGGNLVELLRKIASMVRERIELEREVQALTAQGRLSAWIIVMLIPVSLLILRFFPTYHQILWNTPMGNLVLVVVALLQVAGFLVIRRILRVEY